MKRLHKLVTAVCLAVISVFFLMVYTIIAKELPILVDVAELNETYDGKRVAVMGWAHSAETLRGRMGSNYLKTELGKNGQIVTVFTAFPAYNIVNNRVIVQGIYHYHGRYGGYLAEHFIDADTLMRDWG